MSAGDGRERLLAALLEGDGPAPELLARYATDPSSLSSDERSEIEQALDVHPELADELRTLRSFRGSGASARPRRSASRRGLLAGLALAAAAGLVLVVAPRMRRELEPSPALPSAPAPQIAQRDPVPSPAPAARVEPPPPDGEAPAPRLEPERPAKTRVARSDPAPATALTAPEPPPREQIAPGPIAMLEPSYRRPAEALDRPRTLVALRGPADGASEPSVLAPEHVALTRTAAPELFWSLSGPAPQGSRVLLRILDESSGDALLDVELPLPREAGLQRIRLSEQGVALAPDVVYTWLVLLRTDPDSPARDRIAQGWILRRAVEIDAAVAPAALPAQLAGAGLWYDALATALDLRARDPGNASIQRGVRALLEQGGVRLDPEP